MPWSQSLMEQPPLSAPSPSKRAKINQFYTYKPLESNLESIGEKIVSPIFGKFDPKMTQNVAEST